MVITVPGIDLQWRYLHGVPQCCCNVFSVSRNSAYLTYKGHAGQMHLLGKLTNLDLGLREGGVWFFDWRKKGQIYVSMALLVEGKKE